MRLSSCLVVCGCLFSLVVPRPTYAQDGSPAQAPEQPAQTDAVEVPSPATDTSAPVAPSPSEPVAPSPSEPVDPRPTPASAVSAGTATAEKAPIPAAIALAPVATTPAFSPVYTGSFFTRLELRSGYGELGVARPPRFLDGDAVFYRARFGISTGLIDVGSDLRVGLFFAPQASGVMGTLASTTSDASLGLHEGYVRVQGKIVRLDAGRFELNYGDSLVIGNLDWHETARSFDGLRARLTSAPDAAWLDAFATFLDEGRPDVTRVSDGDVYLLGLYAGLGPWLGKAVELDVYALARIFPESRGLKLDPTAAMGPNYLRERAGEATFGTRAKQKLGMLDYRFEAGLQTGSRPNPAPKPGLATPVPDQAARDVLAYHADLELGLSLVPERLRIGAEALYASGDDADTSDRNEGWDELYPTAHKFLGLSDAFAQSGIKRTNVASGVLHATTTPLTGLSIQADGHLFARVQSGQADKGIAAVEADLSVNYTLAKGLKLRGLYALFLPQADPSTQDQSTRSDAAQFGEVELRYDL